MSFKNEDIPFTLVSRNKPTSSPQMTSSRDINPDKFKSVIGHLVYKKWIEKNEDGTWCVLVPKDEKIYRNINDALDVCLSKGTHTDRERERRKMRERERRKTRDER